MNGSYQLQNFTKNKETEVTRLKTQVELFFEKEFDLYKKIGLKDGMDLIECGSGPGYLIKNILERLPACNAFALEIDSFLYSVLVENSTSDGKKLYTPINGSIYDTKFPDNKFDFVITRLVVEHLEEPLKAINELSRILKPGGKLVIVSNDFAYHLLTYPVIPELDEMYDAYCKSRFSEGGNPLIGRQLPVYLENSNFEKVRFEIVAVHSKLSGDESFLKAENVNISKSLVEGGYLDRNILSNLVEKWFQMLKDPFHILYRQLVLVSGEKTAGKTLKPYSKELEAALKGKPIKDESTEAVSPQEQQRQKFMKLMNRTQLSKLPDISSSATHKTITSNSDVEYADKGGADNIRNRFFDANKVETTVSSIWKKILKTDQINLDDNYFDIGGDSILIPEMVQMLYDKHGIKLKILDIFDNPSIRTLSDYIIKNNR